MEFNLKGSEYIELKNLLKVAGLVETGSEAKLAITDGLVRVNGEVETRKANKIKSGMTVTFDGQSVTVKD